jgi:hypothetical protein
MSEAHLSLNPEIFIKFAALLERRRLAKQGRFKLVPAAVYIINQQPIPVRLEEQ